MAHEYFENLNYTMANEDTTVEYTLLPESAQHVLAIAGSGSRVLPLFAKHPKSMTICDYSQEQLALTQTRIETVRSLDHEQFLSFWGYPSLKQMDASTRQSIFKTLALSEQNKEIMSSIFAAHQWEALLYTGNYEKAIIKLSQFIQKVLGPYHIKKLQNFNGHYPFREYMKNEFPHLKWKMLVKVLGNSTLFNALLYKGKHPKKNIDLSYSQYYTQMFEQLFSLFIPRESFFLQLVFFGKILESGATPLEADPKIFKQMKEGISGCKVTTLQGDLFENIKQVKDDIDFVSFSDILSYFPEELGKIYLQDIKHKLSPRALTVHRYYFHISKNLDTTGYTKLTETYPTLINKEKTQIYLMDIYQRNAHV